LLCVTDGTDMKRTTLVLAALAILGPALPAQLLPLPRVPALDIGPPGELGGGFAAGVSTPLRDVGRIADPGYHLTAFLTTTPSRAPVGDRLEASFNQFNYSMVPGSSGGHVRILSLAMNGLLNMPDLMHPYVIGGIGYYHASSTCGGCAKWNRPGANVGVGAQFGLGSVQAYCEVRGHYIASQVDPAPDALHTGTWFVPVSFGLKF
jgi:hypothetical protein